MTPIDKLNSNIEKLGIVLTEQKEEIVRLTEENERLKEENQMLLNELNK